MEIVTCRIEVDKVGDGVLLVGECRGAGCPGPGPRQGARHAPRAAPAYGQGVGPLPRLLPHPQRVQTRQRPAAVSTIQSVVHGGINKKIDKEGSQNFYCFYLFLSLLSSCLGMRPLMPTE